MVARVRLPLLPPRKDMMKIRKVVLRGEQSVLKTEPTLDVEGSTPLPSATSTCKIYKCECGTVLYRDAPIWQCESMNCIMSKCIDDYRGKSGVAGAHMCLKNTGTGFDS